MIFNKIESHPNHCTYFISHLKAIQFRFIIIIILLICCSKKYVFVLQMRFQSIFNFMKYKSLIEFRNRLKVLWNEAKNKFEFIFFVWIFQFHFISYTILLLNLAWISQPSKNHKCTKKHSATSIFTSLLSIGRLWVLVMIHSRNHKKSHISPLPNRTHNVILNLNPLRNVLKLAWELWATS